MLIYHEITNVCNRHCRFCPGTKRPPCFVEPARFAERLMKTRSISDRITLHVMGEPLLHPRFDEIAGICLQNGIPVNLTTNGTLLNEAKKEILFSNPIFRQINFSIHAIDDTEDSLLENILAFCVEALEKRPELYINLRLWNLDQDFSGGKENEHKLEKIYRILETERPAQLNFSGGRKSRKIKGRIYLNCDTLFEWPETCPKAEKETGSAFCHGLSAQLAILADGTVVPCCLDSEGRINLGNIDREPIDFILNSSRSEAIRHGFQKGIAAEELCKKCSFRLRFNARP